MNRARDLGRPRSRHGTPYRLRGATAVGETDEKQFPDRLVTGLQDRHSLEFLH